MKTMKKIVFAFLFQLIVVALVAQAPVMFNYQAVVRDNLGNPTVNEATEITISIIEGSVDGLEVFSELHDVTTNDYGIVNLQIGSIEDLSVVDWSSDIYFVEVMVNDVVMGTSQLLSVPMALNSKTTDYYEEMDPYFVASPANMITDENVNQWSAAAGWGDHAGLYLASDYIPDMSGVVNTSDNQDVAGVKNFTETITVPTPQGDFDAVPKEYVDALLDRIYALEIAAGLVSIEDIDGNSYEVVTLGNQIWFAENLKVKTLNDGTPIELVNTNPEWNSTVGAAYTHANHDPFYEDVYGVLYNWSAVNTGALCPSGWHVPSNADWGELITYLTNNGYGFGGSGDDIAKSLSSTDLWQSSTSPGDTGNDLTSNNSTGFNARPSAFMRGYSDIDFPGSEIYLWTSDEFSLTDAYYVGWTKYADVVNQSDADKTRGNSVRCLKD